MRIDPHSALERTIAQLLGVHATAQAEGSLRPTEVYYERGALNVVLASRDGRELRTQIGDRQHMGSCRFTTEQLGFNVESGDAPELEASVIDALRARHAATRFNEIMPALRGEDIDEDARAIRGDGEGGGVLILDADGWPDSQARLTSGGLHEGWGAPHRWRTFVGAPELARRFGWAVHPSPWISIEHGDVECRHVQPDRFVAYPWRPGLRPALRQARPAAGPRLALTTHMDDVDVITGGYDKLEEALEQISRAPEGGVVEVHPTCVPLVIGDDTAGVVRGFEGRSRCRLVVSSAEESVVDRQLLQALRAHLTARAERDPDPATVNLVGYLPERGLEELCGLLPRFGARAGVDLVPRNDAEACARFLDAGVQVLARNEGWRQTYELVFRPLPLKTLTPPSPYGLQASMAWLEQVAAATDRAAAFERWRGEVLPDYEVRLARSRQALSGVAVGFVLDTSAAGPFFEPSRRYGVDLLPSLLEADVALRLALYDDGLTPPAEAIAAVEARLGVRAARLTTTAFADAGALDAWLSSDALRLVFSDYTYDTRVTSRGKAPFSLQVFEPGLEGAIRTIDRLGALARLGVLSRYGRYLGPRGGGA